PRALTTDEIKEYVATYVAAAKNAIRAGFDGVEFHGANGYLIDQSIQDVTTNQRTDEYGGSIENCARFTLELTDAVVEVIGAERTGFRMSPWDVVSGMGMADPKPQTHSYLVKQLRRHKLAYIHVVEPMPAKITAEKDSDCPRDIWKGHFQISTNVYTCNGAIEMADNKGGLVGFERLFMSNMNHLFLGSFPDLPFRLLKDIALERGDQATWYMRG
ncbi:oxidoreductase, partial [Suillus occidentalis]